MKIGSRPITTEDPTYFIADIAANHDGDLARAVDLIHMAAEAGADAAKFQHFRAEHIVSDRGFKELGRQQSHQASWSRSVFETYSEASLPWDWTESLSKAAIKAGIHFFTSPYDFEAIDFVDPYVPAYKIGSGDITWIDAIHLMASKGKPVLLATGASDLEEVRQAVAAIEAHNVPFAVMQCNTNYTGQPSNVAHTHLRVLETFANEFPKAVLGLSDHTHGDVTVLGAVAMGARLIEKHFTDDTRREGPDHHFSMTPATWATMVQRTRDLEAALGSSAKNVAENETETTIIQRRGLRFSRPLDQGTTITAADLVALRPATSGGFSPAQSNEVIGQRVRKSVGFHELVTRDLLED